MGNCIFLLKSIIKPEDFFPLSHQSTPLRHTICGAKTLILNYMLSAIYALDKHA